MDGPVSCGDAKRTRLAVGEVKVKVEEPLPSEGLENSQRARTDSTTVKKEKTERERDPGPFPNHRHPTRDECYRAHAELATLHGRFSHGHQGSVLDSLVRTMLSQNTTDVTSARAFAQFKKRFPNYEKVHANTNEEVAETIRCCGLADIRAARIKGILDTLMKERGELCLEHLRDYDNSRVKKELTRFKGVGPKTAACVLMFCLQRAEFPVDTHVWRITKKLGWVPKNASREQTYEHLNYRVPDDIKYSLHVQLVEHGKCCKRCAKNGNPRRSPLGPCPLTFPGDVRGKVKLEKAAK